MKKPRIPEQLDAGGSLVRSWSVDHPKFYGEKTTTEFADDLLEAERCLELGTAGLSEPRLCRVIAAYHGPKGAKVPLSIATTSGCVRPEFVRKNDWLQP